MNRDAKQKLLKLMENAERKQAIPFTFDFTETNATQRFSLETPC